MISRKKFLETSLFGFAGLSFLDFNEWKQDAKLDFLSFENLSPSELAEKEDFWAKVRAMFTLTNDFILLNNGSVSPPSEFVQKIVEEEMKLANQGPSLFMRVNQESKRESLRNNIAKWLNVSADEIAFTRNATEGLSTIIFGLPLQKGDEVIISRYDYPYVINAWKQREKRDGIVLKWVEFKLPFQDETLIESYKLAFTEKTRFVQLTHVLNWNGQILPVKELIELAHQNNCEVLLDAAHSFGCLELSISDLKCDYLATSFHKWMNGPIGIGLLYCAKSKISTVWPLFSSYDSFGEDIQKFETIGTFPIYTYLAISSSITYHDIIKLENKRARFMYLANLLIDDLKKMKEVKLFSPKHPENGNGMISFELKNLAGFDLSEVLLKDFKIHTSFVKVGEIDGIRVSPNMFTSKAEIQEFIKAIKKIIEQINQK
jgi:selenocysteine lyase/cysteine desulfurase